MSRKIKLGLIFSNDENWIGGTYYILNLVNTLNTLAANEKPQLVVLSTNLADFELVAKTGYPYLQYQNPIPKKRNIVEAVINRLCRFFFRRNIIDKRISGKQVDVLFPARFDDWYSRIPAKVFWFADFQHIVYPDFFSAQEIEERNLFLKAVASTRNILVVSSQSAQSDWERIAGDATCITQVMPFAVRHPSLEGLQLADLLQKFNLPAEYLLVSNQFWQHKNHLIVLKASHLLKKKGIHCTLVFTGKQEDYRNPHYFTELKRYVSEAGLSNSVYFLGLIDRKEQLKLMQHARAVIQPSLFEGWSTVLEDAKLLQVPVLASDIPVHREQLPGMHCFFNPLQAEELAEKIATLPQHAAAYRYTAAYQNSVVAFAENIKRIITLAIKNSQC
jgi:glycosyltransferase involved in cell wall biosynthesis